MSYTEIYGFDKAGNAFLYDEIGNSWRGGMAVWNILEEKYLPTYRPSFVPKWVLDSDVESFLHYKPKRTSCMFEEKNPLQEIWELFDSEKISENEKIVLGTTFDYVLVKKEDFQKVIEAFESFKGETSLKEQAEVISKMLKDDNVIAVGWNQTSVNADTWENFGGFDEETGESIPYNFFTIDKHWYLFEEATSCEPNK